MNEVYLIAAIKLLNEKQADYKTSTNFDLGSFLYFFDYYFLLIAITTVFSAFKRHWDFSSLENDSYLDIISRFLPIFIIFNSFFWKNPRQPDKIIYEIKLVFMMWNWRLPVCSFESKNAHYKQEKGDAKLRLIPFHSELSGKNVTLKKLRGKGMMAVLV